jgi:hypothetical protein
MLLSVALLNLTTISSVWNIKKTIFGETNYNIDNTTSTPILQVYYPRGSSTPSKIPGGIGFYSRPNEINRAKDVVLSYSVRFDETFDPVLGGKLPGLYISSGNNTSGGSGGKHTNNTSCRIAWRSNFMAEAYVYLPKNVNQSETYYNNSVQNRIYGDSLWRGQLNFKKDIWNDISLRIRLNTFDTRDYPNMDGLLQLTINNVTRRLDDIILTVDTQSRIETVIFETFFGGSSPLAVTPNDTWSYFKNVAVTKID